MAVIISQSLWNHVFDYLKLSQNQLKNASRSPPKTWLSRCFESVKQRAPIKEALKPHTSRFQKYPENPGPTPLRRRTAIIAKLAKKNPCHTFPTKFGTHSCFSLKIFCNFLHLGNCFGQVIIICTSM